MPTAVADPPVATPAAPAASAAAAPVAAAGSPAGVAAAGSGAGGAAAAPVQTNGASTPAANAAAAAPKALLADAPAKTDAGVAAGDAKPDAAKAAADAAAAKPADWSLELPKDLAGATADDAKAIETWAKAEGLSKTQAEKLLAREVGARAAAETAQRAQVDAAANRWAEQVEKSEELAGKNGEKLPQTIASAKRALTAWATPEQRAEILASPFGNHPTFIAILARAAAALPVEDAVIPSSGGPNSGAGANPAQTIYGKR